MKREFKYYPDDFPELPVKVEHFNLTFDVYDKKTEVVSEITFTANKALKEVQLDAKKIEIKKVESEKPITWKYEKDLNKLVVRFIEGTKKGEKITLHIENTIHPTANDLEGLYYDETPEGAPPQQITQCQQWGFQKLTPCFDDMTAKATYRTKIIADERYTHLISNGDIVTEKNLGGGRKEIIYSNEKTPMAPYLFCLCVGTWDSYLREIEYPRGKKFKAELLLLRGSEAKAAERALDILEHGILWINLFTGKGMRDDLKEKKKILKETIKLGALKRAGKVMEAEVLRKKIKEEVKGLDLGYEYTGTVYREIAMQNSNFGGMENVGNTTITANRILPSEKSSDGAFAYLVEVKAHEFYHNINGSEVTGWSPFELWLNEALTCEQEHKYNAFVSGEDYTKLGEVLRIIGSGGTFSEDKGAMGMPIIPEGFNNPDELISGVTYSKAPQVVGMMETLMGEKKFARALAEYHKKFSHKNAKTKDFFEVMEKHHGKNLRAFAESWLRQTGYPEVKVQKKFNPKKKVLELSLQQKGYKKAPWVFPIKVAGFGGKGKLFEETLVMTRPRKKFFLKCEEKPLFCSFNRGFSFYGKISCNETIEEKYARAEKDDDVIARFLAFYDIAEKEKLALIDGKKSAPSAQFIKMFYSFLANERLTESVGGSMLAVLNDVEDKYKRHYYEELYQISKKIEKAFAKRHYKELLKMYKQRSAKKISAPYVEKQFFNIKNRQIKNSCLSLLSETKKPQILALAKKQFYAPQAQSDKLVAYSILLETKGKEREKTMKELEGAAEKNLIEREQFMSLTARTDAEDALQLVQKIKSSKLFRGTQANDQRALLANFCFNKRKSLLTKEGREFVLGTLKELAKINEYNTNYILGVFEEMNYMREDYLPEVVKILVDALGSINEKEQPSVHSNIKRLLKNSPRAVKIYEKKYGKLGK